MSSAVQVRLAPANPVRSFLRAGTTARSADDPHHWGSPGWPPAPLTTGAAYSVANARRICRKTGVIIVATRSPVIIVWILDAYAAQN